MPRVLVARPRLIGGRDFGRGVPVEWQRMSRVGIVGVGAMGSGFAERLLAHGHRLLVWNRTRAALDPLVALGAAAAQSPAEVSADSDFVITSVSDSVALRAVSEGADGIAAGAHPGMIALEMSTVGPDAIRALRETLPASSPLLDVPRARSSRRGPRRVIGDFRRGQRGRARAGPASARTAWFRAACRTAGIGGRREADRADNAGWHARAAGRGARAGRGVRRAPRGDVRHPCPDAAGVAGPATASDGRVGRLPCELSPVASAQDIDLVAENAQRAGLHLRLDEAGRSWLLDAEQDGRGPQDYTAIIATIQERARSAPTAGTEQA